MIGIHQLVRLLFNNNFYQPRSCPLKTGGLVHAVANTVLVLACVLKFTCNIAC